MGPKHIVIGDRSAHAAVEGKTLEDSHATHYARGAQAEAVENVLALVSSLQLQSYQHRISKKDDRSKESSNQRSTSCMHVWYGNTHSYPERFFLFAALLTDILTGRGTVVDC